MLDEEGGKEGKPFVKKSGSSPSVYAEKGDEGFTVKNVDGYAGHIEYGEGEDIVGVLCHGRVVPAGDGWTTPPFSADIRENKIFARGAIDDKDQLWRLYALKMLKDTEDEAVKRIRMIIGTDMKKVIGAVWTIIISSMRRCRKLDLRQMLIFRLFMRKKGSLMPAILIYISTYRTTSALYTQGNSHRIYAAEYGAR
ncbi:hypothetical protein ACEQPO_22375 [Bacillus sp. SL00103]